MFVLQQAGYRYGPCAVLEGLSAQIEGPGLIALIGPNGAGKSTLLHILGGMRPDYQGSATYRNLELRHWPRRALAREISLCPQSLRLEFPFSVEEVVMMGRAPHASGWFDSADDREAVRRALERTDAWAFHKRDFRTLSGGERQRVVLAAALAQQPEVLLLDEPSTFLDLAHQLALYRLLQELAAEGLLVVVVTHDLNLAASHATRVLALHQGRFALDGPPGAALSPEGVRGIFGVETVRLEAPDGRSWIAYGP